MSMSLMERAVEEITKMREKVEKDYHRQKFHISPPAGLINDPNGFIQLDGVYHMFYQLHPFDTKHGLKFWGHTKSDDCISWEEHNVALAPDRWYETHGCYSGSAFNKDGLMHLMYTGNVKDEEGNRETYQCLAVKEEHSFKKLGPVIENQPEGYTRHFRDPKVWFSSGRWNMVIGAQREELTGAVVKYSSKDLMKWVFEGEIYSNSESYMVECPDLFQLDGKMVMLFCPQGLEQQGMLYNNKHQACYITGEYHQESSSYGWEEFIELDRGFEFYAPQTTEDSKGRRIMVAWMGIPDEDEHPTKENGWIHCLTMPRELKFKNGKLYQTPLDEMKKLRGDMVEKSNIKICNEEISLDQFYDDVFELEATLRTKDAESFGIKIRCGESEETIITAYADNKIEVNREHSGKGYGGRRMCVNDTSSDIKFRIFSDSSSFEIFINDGEEVFTGRIYPNENSKGIKLFSYGGEATLISIKKWQLNR